MTAAALVVLGAALAAALAALLASARSRAACSRALARATADLERLQISFARFAPEEVVEQIAARGIASEAAEREVTVLFADLKGFTPLAGTLGPAKVVELLNGWFRGMSAAIVAHNGHVAKFLGDGLMALFGALERNPWQARDAAEAALAMRESLRRYNVALAERGLPALSFGIGIHRGPAVAGIIGSDAWMEYTVVGDTVNVASRVQDLTRIHDADILVTEEVKTALDDRFRLRELPPAAVRGKPEPIRTWALEGTSA
jgi:adenylate cyclase